MTEQVYEIDRTAGATRELDVNAAVGNPFPGFIVASVRVLPAALYTFVRGVVLASTQSHAYFGKLSAPTYP